MYYVSLTGTSGAAHLDIADVSAKLERLRPSIGDRPIAVGFGVRTPEDATRVGALCDAVVVGSALMLSTAGEKPAATTEAALEEAGVSDPAGALDDLVEQVSTQQDGGAAGVEADRR